MDIATWLSVLNGHAAELTSALCRQSAYGTKILNLNTNEVGLLIKTWVNKFADGDVDFATCADKNGKRYNIELDNIKPLEDCDDY